MLSNLPPGCSESYIPGNTPMDLTVDKAVLHRDCIACLWQEPQSNDKLKEMYDVLVKGRDCHVCKYRKQLHLSAWRKEVKEPEACKQCGKVDFSGFEADTLESFKGSREKTRLMQCEACNHGSRFEPLEDRAEIAERIRAEADTREDGHEDVY